MSEGQLKGRTQANVAAQTELQSQVRVLYGVHAIEANLAGRAVGDVRQALRQALNISPQAVAVVDGREVEEGVILLAGQQLEFVRLAGEKGAEVLRRGSRKTPTEASPKGEWRGQSPRSKWNALTVAVRPVRGAWVTPRGSWPALTCRLVETRTTGSPDPVASPGISRRPQLRSRSLP